MENETPLVLTFAILGNVCNFAYNVPFVWVVVKHNSADNISKKFLYLRVFSSMIWITYAILTIEWFVGLSYSVTLLSSSIVLYIKLMGGSNKKDASQASPPPSPLYLRETQL